jgi:hypothetical protein
LQRGLAIVVGRLDIGFNRDLRGYQSGCPPAEAIGVGRFVCSSTQRLRTAGFAARRGGAPPLPPRGVENRPAGACLTLRPRLLMIRAATTIGWTLG